MEDSAADAFNDALHSAAQRGDLVLVHQLLLEGADVNAFDELGLTPLHWAVKSAHIDVARCLLEHGADVNAHDEQRIGNTPLCEVAAQCSFLIAELLITAGADPTVPGWMQQTAITRAAKRKRGDGPKVYALLLQASRRRRA